MTEDIKAAVAILERAMDLEQEGRRFYMKAAKTTQDKKGQEIYNTLAEDESKHYTLIKKQHTSLTSGGRWVASPGVKPGNVDLSKPLFPRDKEAMEKAVTDKSSDWDALLFGLDIEIKSYDLYRNAASEIEDPVGKEIFKFLAGQEQSHFDMMMMRYESLFGPTSWKY